MKNNAVAVWVVLLLVILIRNAWAISTEEFRRGETKAGLKDIEGICVAVENFNLPNVDTATITTEIELLLRQYGLRVISPDEYASSASERNAILGLNCIVSGSKGTALDLIVYTAVLTISRKVAIVATGEEISADIYKQAQMAGEPSSDVARHFKDSVVELVKTFINDYLSANPKISVNVEKKPTDPRKK